MRNNEELETDVREELAWDPRFDDREIFVVTDHGVVTLTGSVASAGARAAAEAAVARVLGVESVVNELLVEPHFEPRKAGTPHDRPNAEPGGA
ncbi:MAG TPA: BON domain-containing protein [Gemmatimonadaceae bacterium]|jgi:osmotically-inducible protein OsmY|nr:BON domain-containing protein [Gemmatimonadaceae bacterium]